MAIVTVGILGLVLIGSPALAHQATCGESGSCDASGPAMIQHRTARELKEALATKQAVTQRESARQEAVVGALECIDRMFGPMTKQSGFDNAEGVLKDAVAEAMAELAASSADETDVPTVDEAAAHMWKSYQEWYCALAGNSECILNGMSWATIFSEIRADSVEEAPSLVERDAAAWHGASSGVEKAPAGPQCQPTRVETVRDVERGHGLKEGSLTALSDSLELLQRRGVEEHKIMRLVLEQATGKAVPLALTERSTSSQLAKATAQVLKSHDALLLALGETVELEREESLRASSGVLLGRGSCLDTTIDMTLSTPTTVHMMVKTYMKLHCAVNLNCDATYAQIVLGPAGSGGSLMQQAAAVVKGGTLLAARGMVATLMRFLGVQQFDAEAFTERSAMASAFRVETSAEDHRDLEVVGSALDAMLAEGQVDGIKQFIRVTADLIRCP